MQIHLIFCFKNITLSLSCESHDFYILVFLCFFHPHIFGSFIPKGCWESADWFPTGQLRGCCGPDQWCVSQRPSQESQWWHCPVQRLETPSEWFRPHNINSHFKCFLYSRTDQSFCCSSVLSLQSCTSTIRTLSTSWNLCLWFMFTFLFIFFSQAGQSCCGLWLSRSIYRNLPESGTL